MSRARPHRIGTTGATDGQALIYTAATDEYGPKTIPPSGVQSVVQGTGGVTVDNTDPANPIVSVTVPTQLVPMTTEIIGADPTLVWDDDNQLVMTEDH